MIWAVVPAAGSGRRFAAAQPKQYVQIDGCSVLEWTLRRLAAVPRISGLMVVLSAADRDWPNLTTVAGKPVLTATGGDQRADSVLAGLRALPNDAAADDFVLVHDAARPCVRAADIDRLIDRVQSSGGGLLAAPVRDTLKCASASIDPPCVAQTLDRSGLWRALTPQMFQRDALMQALETARTQGVMVTDEAQAMERAGIRPLLVEGSDDNIKVTTANDLALARFLLRNQGCA